LVPAFPGRRPRGPLEIEAFAVRTDWHASCFTSMRSIPTLIAAIATTWMVGTATAADDAAPHGEAPPGVAVETTPPATRPAADEALEAALARALEDDGRVNAMQIKVAVREGLVTLTGTAKDIKEKDAAEATV